VVAPPSSVIGQMEFKTGNVNRLCGGRKPGIRGGKNIVERGEGCILKTELKVQLCFAVRGIFRKRSLQKGEKKDRGLNSIGGGEGETEET